MTISGRESGFNDKLFCNECVKEEKKKLCLYFPFLAGEALEKRHLVIGLVSTVFGHHLHAKTTTTTTTTTNLAMLLTLHHNL